MVDDCQVCYGGIMIKNGSYKQDQQMAAVTSDW